MAARREPHATQAAADASTDVPPVPVAAPTAARTLIAVQRGAGNAAATALARSVLARDPAAPAAEPEAPTGIGDEESLARYAARARAVLDKWDDYPTPYLRARALLSAVNAEIVAGGGCPVRDVVLQELPTEGHFERKTWTATLDEKLFTGRKPGGGHAHRAAVVAHEARHCEQAFLAARLMAGRGRSWYGIVKQLGIPEEPAKAAHARPIEPDDPEAAEAEVFLSAAVGAGSRESTRVLRRLFDAKDEYEKALTAWERAAPADKPALRPAVDATFEEVRAAEAAYHALPEEVDAHELADDVKRAFRELPQPPPAGPPGGG